MNKSGAIVTAECVPFNSTDILDIKAIVFMAVKISEMNLLAWLIGVSWTQLKQSYSRLLLHVQIQYNI